MSGITLHHSGFTATSYDKKDASTQVDDGEPALKEAEGTGDFPDQLRKLLDHYQNTATIHGVAQTTRTHIYAHRRVIWLLLVASMAIGLTVTLFSQLSQLAEYPVRTTITATMRDRLEFPAVTICNLNQYVRSRVPPDAMIKHVIFYKSEYARLARKMQYFARIIEASNVSDVSGEELLNMSRYAAHTIKEFLIQCRWRSRLHDCEELFTPMATTVGICYTFNHNKSALREASSIGPWAGLRLILDIGHNNYYYSEMMQAGVKVLVHDPDTPPFPTRFGWFIRPGVSASIALARNDNSGLAAPYKAFNNRYCMDTSSESHGNHLKRFSVYTESSCQEECIVDYTIKRCGCRSFNDPGNETLCSGKELLVCHIPVSNSLDFDQVETCQCPPECKTTSYNPTITYADFASDFVDAVGVANNVTPSADYIRFSRSLIDVRIYFSTLNVVDMKQEPQMSLSIILGSLGGQMGLFLGASILSVTELLEMLIVLILRCVGRCWPSNKQGTRKDQAEISSAQGKDNCCRLSESTSSLFHRSVTTL